jgi:iron-sulfur cluster assembly protein
MLPLVGARATWRLARDGLSMEVSPMSDMVRPLAGSSAAARGTQTAQQPVLEQPILEQPTLEQPAAELAEGAPITVTPRAIEMGKQKLAEVGGSFVGIRVGVKGGGCSGLSYHFELAERVREDRDLVLDLDGLKLLVDKRSLRYLEGSVLEWNDGLVEYGFRWKNPNAKKDCGCGSSFSI